MEFFELNNILFMIQFLILWKNYTINLYSMIFHFKAIL